MITCPACGKENDDSAFECKRCRAPLREDVPEEQAPEPSAAAAGEVPSSESLGEVCRRCETFNEPGVRVCTNCGYELFAEAAAAEPAAEVAPPEAWTAAEEPAPDHTPPDGSPSLSDELSALAISDQEAAEAGLSLDKTPPQAYAPPEPEPVPLPPPARGKGAEIAAGAAAGLAARRSEPPPRPPPARAPPAPEPPAEKACASCGAANPPAAKFCFDCGAPFAKKAARAAEPPPSIQVSPSIQVDEAYMESTSESMPLPAEEPLPEEQAGAPADAGEPLPEEATPAASGEPLPEEQPAEEPVPIEEAPPPFPASLVVEKGNAQGTAFALAHLENSLGGSGTHIELAEDPFVAPLAATLLFVEDHLVLRDEGSANGVFVKVRESAPLQAGDLFVAGERLFRFDGPAELARDGQGDTPFLGAPRPQGTPLRIAEVLAGGRTGRTCHRAGPVIAIGRTGCDMNFPADSLLAAKHAEIRIAEDGGATLVDLGAGPSGVWLRIRPQGQHDLLPGDLLQLGDQQLRVDIQPAG